MRWEESHPKVNEAVCWHYLEPVLLALVLTPLRRKFFLLSCQHQKTKRVEFATENELPSRKIKRTENRRKASGVELADRRQ